MVTEWAKESLRHAISKLEEIIFPNVPKFEKGPSLIQLKDWLGGLDSNQDSQIQSLESYQLDDLPAGRTKRNRSIFPRIGTATIRLF
jgi:hypothetical protein